MTAVRQLSDTPASAFPDAWYEVIPEGHFWLEWRFRAFQRQLDVLAVPRFAPWRGLDVGCGHGVLRRQLEEVTSWVIDGADLSAEGLAQNRARRGETYRYDVRDRRPAMAGRYDFALLFDVIEHIDDPRAFLEAVRYHVRPGGWLFTNVPALDRFRSAFDRAVGHRRRYDRRTIATELGAGGFEIRDLRYWGLAMLPYLVLRKVLPPRDASVVRVLQHGAHPPMRWMTHGIRMIMVAETALCPRPPLGTSLLAAAVRR